jgi:NTP pyrophosphatase (non-canonical NTP hydrolase)
MLNLQTTIKLHAKYCQFPTSKIARTQKLLEELSELQVALHRNIDKEIIPELADVFITISLYCQRYGYDIDGLTRAKIQADKKRYE